MTPVAWAVVALSLAIDVAAFIWAKRHRRQTQGLVEEAVAAMHREARKMEPEPTPHCYCGKKARKVALYEGRRLLVCSAYCGQRLPKRVAELRGAT